ncbi:ribosomal RNA small subunit methyltransferase A [Candidatus Dojkabacteria bacterium]|nr:ribosomal RNA small subunit methyltransferase A [Candidatus Dojkabacteria bacterium]
MNNYFRKEFGQNFLTSRDFAKKLVESACIRKEDLIIEIGPGAGMVTQYLVHEACKVIAIEIDERFVRLLRNRFLDEDHIEIIHDDILKCDVSRSIPKGEGYKVIGSLPYNISKEVIKKFIEVENPPEDITVIIQKEVAEDYAAKFPRATFLSNYASVFCDVEYICTVPKEFFNPEPKVDGAIIRFVIKNEKLGIENRKKFVKFLKSSFLNPRKKLVNNLSGIYKIDKAELLKIFSDLKIGENARASELELDQWMRLHSWIACLPLARLDSQIVE